MRQLTFGLLLVLVGAAVVRAETSTAEGPTQELAIYAVQRLFPRTATVKDLVCREKQQMLKVRLAALESGGKFDRQPIEVQVRNQVKNMWGRMIRQADGENVDDFDDTSTYDDHDGHGRAPSGSSSSSSSEPRGLFSGSSGALCRVSYAAHGNGRAAG